MLHRIEKKQCDQNPESIRIKDQRVTVDYGDAIVKKPWGYEYLVFENEFVAIWMLHIVRKRKTSMHCHPGKKTSLILIFGKATFYSLEGSIELNPLDSVIIGEGAFHCTEASSALLMTPNSEDGILVMEIETPPLKTDLVRMKDEYGRAGASYEGLDQMVFESKECLKFNFPENNKPIEKTFLDCVFSLRKCGFNDKRGFPKKDALVCVVGIGNGTGSDNPCLKIGELSRFEDFYKNTKNESFGNYTILTIERSEKLVKLSDFVFSFIAGLGVKDVFAVCGGTAMHLVDSLGNNKDLNYIATHHEQAASMAAEGYARISGKPGVVLVSSGPGSTNTITGLYGAWVDSIPIIFISGQVVTDTLSRGTGLRQFGVQEADIVKLVKHMTKYAETITDPKLIRYCLEKAVYMATNGRPGPVWLDIPLDVQSKLIDCNELVSFDVLELGREGHKPELLSKISECMDLLKKAKRPVIISGNGIRLSKAEKEFLQILERLRIPVVSSWATIDIVPTGHELYIGRSGIMGDRAGNFAVQNADLLLIIGSRMSIPQLGYNYSTFGREAKKIVVDIDESELKKPSIVIDISINCDAKEFMKEMLRQLDKERSPLDIDEWIKKCRWWKQKYPVCLPEYKKAKDKVNSFYFIDVLSEKLGKDDVVVTDMGASLVCTMQAFKSKPGQRVFTSSGHGSMGFGLPGSIGACLSRGKKKTICITGDGGLQVNIQELQTVVHHNLPILIFVLNNSGYLTIKLMQQNHFGRYVGADKNSGLSCPNVVKVATAYGIKAVRIKNHRELHSKIDRILTEPGPLVCEIVMSEDQPLIPRVSSIKKPDGTIISKPLEDLYPFLDRKEFLENMIVKSIEILKD